MPPNIVQSPQVPRLKGFPDVVVLTLRSAGTWRTPKECIIWPPQALLCKIYCFTSTHVQLFGNLDKVTIGRDRRIPYSSKHSMTLIFSLQFGWTNWISLNSVTIIFSLQFCWRNWISLNSREVLQKATFNWLGKQNMHWADIIGQLGKRHSSSFMIWHRSGSDSWQVILYK